MVTEAFDQVGESRRRAGVGVARHVSSEGCQFVVQAGQFAAGQHLLVQLGTMVQIGGTVCWSVDDRTGFAFDSVISREEHQEMSRLQRMHSWLDLMAA